VTEKGDRLRIRYADGDWDSLIVLDPELSPWSTDDDDPDEIPIYVLCGLLSAISAGEPYGLEDGDEIDLMRPGRFVLVPRDDWDDLSGSAVEDRPGLISVTLRVDTVKRGRSL
jgi:hypothetical protein